MLGKAIALASELFEDVKDKGGKPYILHCLRVMHSVEHLGEEVMIMGILHDVVEDTDVTPMDLMVMGFSQRVLDGVAALTHDKDYSYELYIKQVALNKDATEVKKADLIDNSNFTRLKGVTAKDFSRMEKYQLAYTYLSKI